MPPNIRRIMDAQHSGAAALAPNEAQIREALKAVVDPEIGLDVINLGLIYDVKIDGDRVGILMTLTTPGCPVAGMFLASVKSAVEALPGVTECNVELTFTPPWDPRVHCTEDAKMMLGLYY
jgi:metal-sulfur cluster biosynthetic enzyme